MTMDKYRSYFENLLNNQTDSEINNTDGTWELAEDQIYSIVEP